MIGRIILVTLSSICALTSLSYATDVPGYFSGAQSVTRDSIKSGIYGSSLRTDGFEEDGDIEAGDLSSIKSEFY